MSKRMREPVWGQLVCGPPGSGKTTYCAALHEFLVKAGRPSIIVNLDPANDSVPYDCAINVYDLVSLEDVASAYELGPNGGMMYCIEFLEKNIEWLEERLDHYSGKYVIFDCPGQAELFTHHSGFASIVERLQKRDFRLCAIHLVDSHHCLEAAKFISVSLISLMTMIRMELPHINVLSKVDMLTSYGELPFSLEFFTDVLDMQQLSASVGDDSTIGHIRKRIRDQIRDRRYASTDGAAQNSEDSAEEDYVSDAADTTPEDPVVAKARERRSRFMEKYRKLNEKIGEVIEDYRLLAFLPLSVKEPLSMLRIMKAVDKANGFIPVHASEKDEIVETPLNEWDFERYSGFEEKYTNKFEG